MPISDLLFEYPKYLHSRREKDIFLRGFIHGRNIERGIWKDKISELI